LLEGGDVQAWHSDDNKNPFGVAISAKPEPKTDVVFKINNKVYATSVKMAGGVQLASGQGESSAQLFESAAIGLKDSKSRKVVGSIVSELRTMPTRMLSESNKKRILTESKKNIIDEFIKDGKIITDKSYDVWLKHNKPQLMDAMLKFIETNNDFKHAILEEALTGKATLSSFKGAVADSIISPKGFYIIDKNYVDMIFPKIKFDVRGKSRGGITSVAFRIDLKS
jgi:hypothetical protein